VLQEEDPCWLWEEQPSAAEMVEMVDQDQTQS